MNPGFSELAPLHTGGGNVTGDDISSVGSVAPTTMPTLIGAAPTSTTGAKHFFKGFVDCVAIWKTVALTDAQSDTLHVGRRRRPGSLTLA